MSAKRHPRACIAFLFLFGIASRTSLGADPATVNFEGFPDSTVLTNQYSGLTFTNAIILSAGITLNEFEFPPHSGTAAASDNGGPITIAFASPVRNVSAFFTYSQALSMQAFDASNNLVASAASRFSNNEALSGTAGSGASEALAVNAESISKVVITGAAGGTSFTMDDLAAIGECDLRLGGTVTVADVQRMINEALGGVVATDDLNQDGVVNVVDVQIEINAALALGCGAK